MSISTFFISIFVLFRYSPQQQLLGEEDEEYDTTKDTPIKLSQFPDYHFSLHMEAYTAGVTTRSTISRLPAVAVPGADTITYSQTVNRQREFKMEDFPVFPTHHPQHPQGHFHQQEWPVRYQSSNMPTSAFFHVTPPPPHVAFDESSIQLDREHHLDMEMNVQSPQYNCSPGACSDATTPLSASTSPFPSPHSSPSPNSPPSAFSSPSPYCSPSTFPWPTKTEEGSMPGGVMTTKKSLKKVWYKSKSQ